MADSERGERGDGNLAVLARQLGRAATARTLCARALATFEQAYGPGHRLTRQCRANLARL